MTRTVMLRCLLLLTVMSFVAAASEDPNRLSDADFPKPVPPAASQWFGGSSMPVPDLTITVQSFVGFHGAYSESPAPGMQAALPLARWLADQSKDTVIFFGPPTVPSMFSVEDYYRFSLHKYGTFSYYPTFGPWVEVGTQQYRRSFLASGKGLVWRLTLYRDFSGVIVHEGRDGPDSVLTFTGTVATAGTGPSTSAPPSASPRPASSP
jgi:hypothetical protein